MDCDNGEIFSLNTHFHTADIIHRISEVHLALQKGRTGYHRSAPLPEVQRCVISALVLLQVCLQDPECLFVLVGDAVSQAHGGDVMEPFSLSCQFP